MKNTLICANQQKSGLTRMLLIPSRAPNHAFISL
jgi:hypothetical protein